MRGCPSQDKGGGLKIRWRRPAWVQIPPPAPIDSFSIYDLFKYDEGLIECLRRVYGKDFNDFLRSLTSPPRRYYIRVNTLRINPGDLLDLLRDKGFRVYVDEVMEEALYFVVEGPFKVPIVDEFVVVDKFAAESVYLGANVYAPGVLGLSSGVRKGCEVNIVSPKGVIVGYGVVVEEPDKVLERGRGILVKTLVSYYKAPKLHELEEYRLGYFYEQAYPSILTVRVLNPLPGEVIVDMCAAPGGKTTHIVELTKGKARVIAFDHSKKKLEKFRDNLRRLGLEEFVEVYRTDSRYLHLDYPWLKADKVLLDPPCTALGVIPKVHDEKRYIDVVNSREYQKQFIKSGYHILKPGGILVYSTCTVTIEENEEIIDFARKVGFKIIDAGFEDVGSRGLEGYEFSDLVLRFHPHVHGTTGYFIALLKKT